MKKGLLRFVILAAVLAFIPSARAANISSVWRNVSATWTNAVNWTNFPLTVNFPDNGNGGFTYDATVGGGSVVLEQDIVVQKFTHTAGTVSGVKSLTANELYTWTGGTESGTGTNFANAGVAVRGAVSFLSRTFFLAGSSTHSNGNMTTGFGGLIGNNGTYNLQDDSDLAHNGSATRTTFRNDGTFIKSGGTNQSFTGMVFLNNGTLRVQTGTFQFSGGGTSSGVITTPPGAVARVADEYIFNGGTFSGGGVVEIANNNFGGVTWTNLITSTVATIRRIDGTVSGPGSLLHSGLYDWVGGTDSGTGTNTITGPLLIRGSAFLTGGRRLVPLGSTTLTNGALTGGNGSVLSNAAGRTFTIVDDSDVRENGSAVHPIFDNVGLLQKVGGTNTSLMLFDLNNSGEVRVQSGTLRISNPGVNTGILTTAPNARILIDVGYALNAGTISGGGTLQFDNFNAGTIILTNTVTSRIATFHHTRGAVGGPGNLLNSGLFIWSGGSWNGDGSTNFLNGPFVINGAVGLNDRTLVFGGSGIQSNGTVTLSPGTIISNAPTGTYNIKDDSSILNAATPGTRWFNNAGTFIKSGAGNNVSGQGANVTTISQVLSNSGTVTAQAGNFRFANGYFQSTGTTKLDGGTLTSASGILIIKAGKIMGSGVINGTVINNGLLTPGFSAGSITVNGSLTNLPGASYLAEIGGYNQGSGYDFVTVTGKVTFAGNLIAHFINNYNFIATVTNGTSFTILTSSNTLAGAFANIASGGTLRSDDGYANFLVTYAGSQNLVLNGLTILDDDSDGIPNWWMDQYFHHLTAQAGDLSRPGDDADGDGFTNQQEYLAGTNPVNANSGLHVVAISNEGTSTRVIWQTAGGRTNQLQFTAGGPGGNFTNNFTDLGQQVILPNPGTGDALTNQVDIGGATNVPTRYYRVRFVP